MTRDELLARVRKLEGFTPRASWDYQQHSNGYGTKARFPGEVIDEAEAERRLRTEVANAEASVDRFAPNLDPGTRAALVSLTYNAGPKWQSEGLGRAIQSGDMAAARSIFTQYNRAGGEVNSGLVNRRGQEVAWPGAFGNPGAPVAPPQPADGMDARTYNTAEAPNSPAQAPGRAPAPSNAQSAERQPAAPQSILGSILSGDVLRAPQEAVASLFGPPAPTTETSAGGWATTTQKQAEPWQQALAQLSGQAPERQPEQKQGVADEFTLSPMGVPQHRKQDLRQIISSARQPIRLGITRA